MCDKFHQILVYFPHRVVLLKYEEIAGKLRLSDKEIFIYFINLLTLVAYNSLAFSCRQSGGEKSEGKWKM